MPIASPREQTCAGDRYFDAVINAAQCACSPEFDHHIEVATHQLRLCFSNASLEARLFPALRHLQQNDGAAAELTIAAWSSPSTALVLDKSPWPARAYWEKGQMLSVRDQRGHVAFDPRAGTISVYDRKLGAASLWVRSEGNLPLWVSGSPLLEILNWWLADNDVMLCHAAAIGTPNGAVLLVGKGGSGKSTVALSSLASSLQYIGDDYVAVRGGHAPKVYSIYNSGKLEPDHMQHMFPGLASAAHRSSAADCDKSLIFIADTHPQKLLVQAPIEAILVPKIGAAEHAYIKPIARLLAFQAIGPSTLFQLPGNKRAKFSMLSRFVQKYPTYEINLTNNIKENINLIASQRAWSL